MKCPHKEIKTPHKIYSTTERNQLHGLLIDCSACSHKKRRRCWNKPDNNHSSNPIPAKKMEKLKLRTKRGHKPIPIPSSQMLYGDFKVGYRALMVVNEIGEPIKKAGRKHFIIEKIVYARTVSRYQEQIHE